jgi:hypothetical protein
MSDGIEQIESRLAAYIDGELSESERAEIDRYLASNPAHQKLIQELKAHKQYLACLPRESAPAEVLDHLQSHLERQALLENVENDANMLRINRWPQWGAIAATLVLAVGLGVLVFSVLPGGFLNHENIAIAPPSVQNLPKAPSLDETHESGLFTDPPVMSPESGFSGKATDSPRLHRSLNVQETDTLRSESPEQLSGASTSENTGNSSTVVPSLPRPGRVMIVSTDDPLLTRNLLAGYLGQNQYDYVSVSPQTARIGFEGRSSSPMPTTLPAGFSTNEFSPSSNDSSAQAPASEQGLIVRNLSQEDLEKIQEVINTQRGNLQHARLIDLAPLISVGNPPKPTTEPSAIPLQETIEHTRSLLDSASSTTMPAQDAQPRLRSIEPGSNPQQDSMTGINAPLAIQATAPPAEKPGALSETSSDTTTDVMIIVRQESPSVSPTIPSTLPASSQPAENLPRMVVPSGSTDTPTSVATEVPSTQPSPISPGD